MSDEITPSDVRIMMDHGVEALANRGPIYPYDVQREIDDRLRTIEDDRLRHEEERAAERAAERAKDPVAFDKKEKEERAKEVLVNIALVVAGFLFISFSKVGPKDESKAYEEKQKERLVQFEKDMTATSRFKRSAINHLDTPQGAAKLRDVFNLLKAKKEKGYSFVVFSHGKDYPDETTYVLVPPVKQLAKEESLLVCVNSPVVVKGDKRISGDTHYIPFSLAKSQFTQKIPPFKPNTNHSLYRDVSSCEKLLNNHIPYNYREKAKTYFAN